MQQLEWSVVHLNRQTLDAQRSSSQLIPWQTLTVHLYEFKKALKVLENKFPMCMWFISAATKTTSRSASDGGLANDHWSMGEPIQKRLRQIGVSCWDPQRFEMHLQELFFWGFLLTFLSMKHNVFTVVSMCTSESNILLLVCEQSNGVAGAQIVCQGQGAGLLPVSHRMWGILSGNSKEGRPASKAGGSGQGMERGRQDRGRRQTRPETKPCIGERSHLNSVHFNINWTSALCSRPKKLVQIRYTILYSMLWIALHCS